MRFSDFSRKEVINVCNCKSLGYVQDLIFDECNGHIKAIIIPGPGKWMGMFCRDHEFVIEWECIVRIGPDIILVDIKEESKMHKL